MSVAPKTLPDLLESFSKRYPDDTVEQLVGYIWHVADAATADRTAIFEREVSAEDALYLRRDNPVLLELQEAYREALPTDATVWSDGFLEEELDMHAFRGDNCYVWQVRAEGKPLANESNFACSALYLDLVDKLKLFDTLTESGNFGIHAFPFRGKLISRALIDSIIELNFLAKHLRLHETNAKVLDIGAGYGRFAVRCAQAFPKATIYATDAIAESTFLCDFYARHNKVDDRVQTVPFHQLSETLPGDIFLATNIHSFTEMSMAFVTFWLSELERLRVPYFFFVPNDRLPSTIESDGSRCEIIPEIQKAGYRLLAMSGKYSECQDLERSALHPTDYYLFEREDYVQPFPMS